MIRTGTPSISVGLHDWLRRVGPVGGGAGPGEEGRAGMAAGGEGGAVDHHLVGVGEGDLPPPVAVLLVLHADVRPDRADGAGLAAGRPAALRHRQPDARRSRRGAGYADVEN